MATGEITLPSSVEVPQTAAPAESAAAPVVSTQQAQASTAVASQSAGDPGLAAAQGAAPQTAAEWQGVRDYARANGVELPFADDHQALQALLRSHQQATQRNYYAELGQRVAPQQQRFAEFLKAQRAPQQPAAPPAWQGPEFRDEWLSLVERDPNTNQLRSKAGYDPEIAGKVQAFIDWRETFLKNPEKVVAPLIEQRAQQLIEAMFAQHSERQLADQIVSQNASWIFAADANGSPVYGADGRRQFSPAGAMYVSAHQQLWNAGLRDIRTLDAVARQQVENQLMRQRLMQMQPAPVQSNGAPVAQPSVGGQLTRPQLSQPHTNGSQNGLSLRERLNKNLANAPEDLSL